MKLQLEGLPMPKDAPEAGACVRIERPEPGIAVLILDPPHRKIAVFDVPLIRDLDAALTELERDSNLKGLVITGRSPLSFAAGADIDAIASITDPKVVRGFVRTVQDLYQRIHDLSAGMRRVRTVAAVGGPVPGGAYELALACERIVAADSKKTRIGLPETQLGIIPGWGGSQRLPRRIGLPGALDAILTGKLYPARAAYKRGMIDRVTPPEYIVRIAIDIAAGRKTCRRKKRGMAAWLVDKNPLAQKLIASMAKKKVLGQTRGHYPAPLEAVDLITKAPTTSLRNGFEAEADAIERLAVSDVCKNLIGIFHMSEEAKKLRYRSDGTTPDPMQRAGVLGAGIMGGGIAGVMAVRGLHTRLFDIAGPALDAALIEHRADVAKKTKRRRLEKQEGMAAIDRLDVARELTGFKNCDIVVEAVAERIDIKREVLAKICEQVGPETILGTNTSSLSVDEIARFVPHPERVVGMHFFNPVRRMPLVEIIRGEKTSDEVVTRTAALALRLGKTPVIVKDVAGFLVNRLLGPYLDEALRLVQNGVPFERLDPIVRNFGMPMGPLELLDEVGLDIASHAAQSLHEAYGARMTPSDGLEEFLKAKRLGKKTGRGFYDHTDAKGSKTGARKTLTTDLPERVRIQSDALANLSEDKIIDRLILSMLNEAARCIEEDVVDGPRTLDLATIFGMGFPPFRGGLLRYADTLGASEVVRRLERIAASPDVSARPGGTKKFTPANLLQEMAKDRRSFR